MPLRPGPRGPWPHRARSAPGTRAAVRRAAGGGPVSPARGGDLGDGDTLGGTPEPPAPESREGGSTPGSAHRSRPFHRPGAAEAHGGAPGNTRSANPEHRKHAGRRPHRSQPPQETRKDRHTSTGAPGNTHSANTGATNTRQAATPPEPPVPDPDDRRARNGAPGAAHSRQRPAPAVVCAGTGYHRPNHRPRRPPEADRRWREPPGAHPERAGSFRAAGARPRRVLGRAAGQPRRMREAAR